MKKLILLIVPILLIIVYSCEDFYWDCLRGNGIIVTEERITRSFGGVLSEGEFEITIIPDSVTRVIVETDENLLPYIDTRVSSNKLVINRGTRRCLHSNYPINVYVHTPDLYFIGLTGSGLIICDDLYTDNLSIELTGSGLIDLWNLDALEVKALITGSGEIELWGICDETDLNITGSGVIKAFHLEQDVCTANISGSGDMYVFVYDLLDAQISGSGNIFYKGDPNVIARISGSGNIINSNK